MSFFSFAWFCFSWFCFCRTIISLSVPLALVVVSDWADLSSCAQTVEALALLGRRGEAINYLGQFCRCLSQALCCWVSLNFKCQWETGKRLPSLSASGDGEDKALSGKVSDCVFTVLSSGNFRWWAVSRAEPCSRSRESCHAPGHISLSQDSWQPGKWVVLPSIGNGKKLNLWGEQFVQSHSGSQCWRKDSTWPASDSSSPVLSSAVLDILWKVPRDVLPATTGAALGSVPRWGMWFLCF